VIKRCVICKRVILKGCQLVCRLRRAVFLNPSPRTRFESAEGSGKVRKH